MAPVQLQFKCSISVFILILGWNLRDERMFSQPVKGLKNSATAHFRKTVCFKFRINNPPFPKCLAKLQQGVHPFSFPPLFSVFPCEVHDKCIKVICSYRVHTKKTLWNHCCTATLHGCMDLVSPGLYDVSRQNNAYIQTVPFIFAELLILFRNS